MFQSVGSELLARQGNDVGTGYAESAARQQIAIKFLVSGKLEANRDILMPQFFGRDLALVASGSFVAIRILRSGSDRRHTPDSWVGASRIGADNYAFAEIIDAGEFPRCSIGVEVHGGLGKYAAENLARFGVKFDLFTGWKRDNVTRFGAKNCRQIISWIKMENAVHDLAESKLLVSGGSPI